MTTHEEHEKKEDVEKKVEKFLNKKVFWVGLSIVLVIALVVSLAWPSGIGANKAGNKLVEFLNNEVVPDGGVVFKSVASKGNLYEVQVTYQGKEIPVYVTRDGKYFISSAVEIKASGSDITGEAVDTPTEVPKTDKPKVQLYVWAYCPYGVAAQGPMAEVANLLKGKVDFEIVPYYDGHGAYETQQNKIQLCIQKLASDKYWNYAASFVKNIYPKCGSSRDASCDKNESIALMKTLGIDSTKIMSCVDSQGAALFSEASAKAQTNGVSGSPTITINGVKVNVGRTSEAIKTAICSAFNNAPSECSQTMSATGSAVSGSC